MGNSTTVTGNPQRRQIDNRRKEQAKWRSHVRWKKLVAEHAHVPGVVCVHCLRKHGEPILDRKGKQRVDKTGKPRFVYLTINHKSRAKYWSEDLYCTWDETDMEICCNDCNKNLEIGLKRCPICHAIYINWQDFCCQACWDITHPIEAQKRMVRVQERLTVIKELKARIKADKKAERERYKIDHPKVKMSHLRPHIHDEKSCKLD